ncbi:MAG TPA: EscU/YscU/HrcU family type III secretion system export apparatus switch protein [Spirochaetota bacterium]|nr:EscU/YscU/HrcU family type III secretion system export apparatus switch protein [Spirochaetota bacterium]HPI87841.1 EscU/YscU/HrcU family type III secretion system export apparatus switch protein [Spirochaetota bacterium]HPR47427.1 EscU/YscU/HrcU family type III secretion system export apparatus switch protein [Spirochaetota bacterium]
MTLHKGVALEYSGDVPRVAAKARGHLLQKIIEIAEKHNITVYRNPDLTEVLYNMDPGEEVPVDLYRAVAEVLAYCYRVNGDFKRKIDLATAE